MVTVEECRSKKCRELLKETRDGKDESSVTYWCDVAFAPLRNLRACPKDESEEVVCVCPHCGGSVYRSAEGDGLVCENFGRDGCSEGWWPTYPDGEPV